MPHKHIYCIVWPCRCLLQIRSVLLKYISAPFLCNSWYRTKEFSISGKHIQTIVPILALLSSRIVDRTLPSGVLTTRPFSAGVDARQEFSALRYREVLGRAARGLSRSLRSNAALRSRRDPLEGIEANYISIEISYHTV